MEHFIRVWIHTSKISKVSRNISYVYEFIRRRFHTRIKSNAFETIRVCKIPWMIWYKDTRIKSYTYEKKLHVWKVTRMKNYTYEKLHVLNIELWLVHCYTRIDSFTELLIRVKIHNLLHVTFYTCNLWRNLSTSANHTNNGLSPGRRQAINCTNVGILLIRRLGTNLSEIVEIHTFSFNKISYISKCRLQNSENLVSASMC